MVLSIEPGVYWPGGGGLRIEDCFHITADGNEKLGNYSIGLGADLYQKYRFDLKYIDFVGHIKDLPNNQIATNGLTTFLKDRGFVSLTFKTTF